MTIDTNQQIDKIIKWYGSLDRDYSGVSAIMYARTKLSTLFFELSLDYSDVKSALNESKFTSEKNLTELKHHYIEYLSPKPTHEVSSSENLPFVKTEIELKSIFTTIENKRNSVRTVLWAMQQHISILNKEYKAMTSAI